jgi:hypothetical protein
MGCLSNIGVDFPKIGVELRILFDDARYRGSASCR